MKTNNIKNIILLVLCTFLSIKAKSQNANISLPCHMPPINNAQQFTPTNNAICNDDENYVPNEDHIHHTPIKVIKLNFHYFITNDPNNPRNLTATTGFNNNDTWNTGIQFAKDLVDMLNVQATQNVPMTVPPGNTYPNLDLRYKFVLYTDPNDINDKGVYFHTFNDWWDNVNNQPNTASDFWYKHWWPNGIHSPGAVWYLVHLKNTYSVHGESVVDVFFLDNTLLNDIGGASVSTVYTEKGLPLYDFGNSVTDAAFTCSDAYEGWNNGLAYHNNWAGHIFHEIGHTMDLFHTSENDECADTWNPTGGCVYPSTNIGENNVMSYCPKSANAFSPCQLGRIHRFLETNRPRWVYDEICKTNDAETITIQNGQNITWNSTKHLNGIVIIEPNATLTIKCDVFIKELGYIKVKEKGHLIIDGGRVTSECDDKLFYGKFVLGDETKNQTINNQGLIELKNDATIENAIIGIRTGDFYYNQNNLSWPQFSGKTGGIIKATNSHFRNNRKSVEFMKYHNILPHPLNIEVDNASFLQTVVL